MKVRRLVAVLSCCVVGFCAYAQSSVKAVLVEEASGDPVSYATVTLTKDGATKPMKYLLSSEKGAVAFDKIKDGTYTFKAELLGYETYTKVLKLEGKDIDLGSVKLKNDSQVLDAATVSDLGNPVVIKKDTIEYNASSFRTTDNDMLEDLLKKLPGVEVSDEGAVTVNGESISKITIDGKTFFLDDPQLASKNIPAKLVRKLKVIKKKSEQSEFTGIDDGEETNVIDLSVQPGMMKGLMGNLSAGVGADIPAQKGIKSEVRYQGNGFVGRFTEGSQISLILNANNTNNQGANDMAGGMMRGMMGGGGGMGRGSGGFGGGNGITKTYMGGLNGAFDLLDDRMQLGGNYVYNRSENDVEESSLKTTFLPDYNLLYDSKGTSSSTSNGHRFGLRLEHKFSDNASILFQPQVNFGDGNYIQQNDNSTFREDGDGSKTKVNDAYTNNTGSNKNVSASGWLLYRQKLGMPGRTLTLMVDFSLSNNKLNGLNNNGTTSYDTGTPIQKLVNQSFDNKQNSYSLSADLTFTEPLGNNFYIQADYSYSWDRSESDKKTFDLNNGGLQDYTYSNNIINENNRQEIGVTALYQNTKFRAQLGFSALPTKTHNSTTKYNPTTDEYAPKVYDDFRWNFAPQAMLFGEFNDNWNARIFYRGNSSQPSTSQLMPVPDNSDPLNIAFGNPGLTPYFTHRINGDLRFSNRERFSSFNLRLNGGFTQKPIINATWYGSNGGQYSMPFNGPTSGNASINAFANVPFGKSAFSLNNSIGANWSKNTSYVGTDVDMTRYTEGDFYEFMEWFIDRFNDPTYREAHISDNTIQSLGVNERLRLTYRGKSLEATLGGSTRMNRSWYTVSTLKDNTTTWNNQISANLNWDWAQTGLGLKADYDFNWYNGYSTHQPSQHVLNLQISKLLCNNNLTLTLKGYDILGQSKNLTVTDSANYHNEVVNNTLGRYVVLTLTWRFGTMGQRGGRGGRGPMGGGHGPGGPMPMMIM